MKPSDIIASSELLVVAVLFWLAVHLLARCPQRSPGWRAGVSLAGAGLSALLASLALHAADATQAMGPLRWIGLSSTVSLLGLYLLGRGLRYPAARPPLPLLLALLTAGGAASLSIALAPGLFWVARPGLAPGSLFPLWHLYSAILAILGLYHVWQAGRNAPTTRQRRRTWQRLLALSLLALGTQAGGMSMPATAGRQWLATCAYASGGVLLAYWLSADSDLLPGSRLVGRELVATGAGALLGVLVSLGVLQLAEWSSGVALSPQVRLLVSAWTVILVAGRDWGEQIMDLFLHRPARELRGQLREWLRSTVRLAATEERVAILVNALGGALGADELCLIEFRGGSCLVRSHYALRPQSTPLLATVRQVEPQRLSSALASRGAHCFTVPCHQPNGMAAPPLLAIERLTGEPELDEDDLMLIGDVSARIGQILDGSDLAATAEQVASTVDEEQGVVAQLAVWPLRQELRWALRHLHDWPSLGNSPLAKQVPGATPWQRGEALHDVFVKAIQDLRPPEADPDDPAWRQYVILEQHYVEARARPSLLPELALSERQYQRELRNGIDALSARLARIWQPK